MKKHITSLLIIILISSFSLVFSAAISYNTALDKYTDLFSSVLSESDRLAFVSFDSIDDDLSTSIISDLEERLINKGIYVVERRGINTLIDEMEFQTSGIVDEKSAVTIGKITGATKVIIGKGEHLASSYRVELRMIDLESLSVVRGAIFDRLYDSTLTALISDTSNMRGSQGLSLTVKAGLGIHNHILSDSLTKNDIYPNKTKVSNPFILGVSLVYKTPTFLKLQCGVDMKLKNGFAHPYIEGNDREGQIEFASADCNLLLIANIVQSPFSIDIFGGPVFSKPLGKDKYIDYQITGGAWGVLAGLNCEIPLGKGYFVIQEGFLMDLTFFSSNVEGTKIDLIKRRDAILSVGYSFRLF